MARSHMASASGFLFLEYCSNARSRSPGYFCIISSNTTTSSMPWKDLPVVRTFLGWQIRAQDDIVQGDPSGWSLALVDIKTKVPSQLYAKNITFIFMSTRASNQLDGYPCKKWGWAKKGGKFRLMALIFSCYSILRTMRRFEKTLYRPFWCCPLPKNIHQRQKNTFYSTKLEKNTFPKSMMFSEFVGIQTLRRTSRAGGGSKCIYRMGRQDFTPEIEVHILYYDSGRFQPVRSRKHLSYNVGEFKPYVNL